MAKLEQKKPRKAIWDISVKAVINAADSRDEAEGPLLPEEDAPSDLASFQPPDSDLPSFLEDCNRVAKPFLFFKAAEQESKELLSYNLFNYTCMLFYKAPFTHHNICVCVWPCFLFVLFEVRLLLNV